MHTNIQAQFPLPPLLLVPALHPILSISTQSIPLGFLFRKGQVSLEYQQNIAYLPMY